MVNVFRSYQRFQGVRGDFGALPAWARYILAIFALPGIVALALSVLAICVSLMALLLLTVPVYIALKRLTGGRGNDVFGPTVVVSQVSSGPVDMMNSPVDPMPAPRRHVDVKILGET